MKPLYLKPLKIIECLGGKYLGICCEIYVVFTYKNMITIRVWERESGNISVILSEETQ